MQTNRNTQGLLIQGLINVSVPIFSCHLVNHLQVIFKNQSKAPKKRDRLTKLLRSKSNILVLQGPLYQ